MDNNKGWISLHRKILDNPVIPMKKPYSRFEAWVYLLLNVNHSEGKVVIGNEIIIVAKGSRVTSIMKLCKAFGWGNTKVRNFLDLLQKDSMIKYESNTRMTLISICNYATYQNPEPVNKSVTTYEQTADKSVGHVNNNELIRTNNKPIKERVVNDTEFDLWWSKYPKKRGKGKARDSFYKLTKEKREIAKATIENHVKYWVKEHTDMIYIPNPATWLNQGRYEDELELKSVKELREEEKIKIQQERWKKETAKAEEEKASPEEIRKIIKEAIGNIGTPISKAKRGDSYE